MIRANDFHRGRVCLFERVIFFFEYLCQCVCVKRKRKKERGKTEEE